MQMLAELNDEAHPGLAECVRDENGTGPMICESLFHITEHKAA